MVGMVNVVVMVIMVAMVIIITNVNMITLRIARPRNALWRAILRWAILSMSFIRIARPIYFVFFVLKCPSNSLMCCLE